MANRKRSRLMPSERTRSVLVPTNSRCVFSFSSHKCEANIECSSEAEYRTCFILNADNRVLRFHEQPKFMRWTDKDGVEHRHTPDFRVVFETGPDHVYEVKPAEDYGKFEDRTNQAKEHYRKENVVYDYLDEAFWDRQPLLSNSYALWRHGLKTVHRGLKLAVNLAFQQGGIATLGDLEHAVSGYLNSRDDLLHLAVNRYLTLDLETDLLGRQTRILNWNPLPLRPDGTPPIDLE